MTLGIAEGPWKSNELSGSFFLDMVDIHFFKDWGVLNQNILDWSNVTENGVRNS